MKICKSKRGFSRQPIVAAATAYVAVLMACGPLAASAQDAPQQEPAAPNVTAPSDNAPASAAAAPAASNDGGIEEIVVTARRSSEKLQDIPVSVQAVSAADIEKFAITSVTDVSKLTPGLTMSTGPDGAPTVSMRGVNWSDASGSAAIPIYLNESAVFDSANLLQAMYDIGQIQVLRGPQGTARGAPSISGAVTIATRAPELSESGGYFSALGGQIGHRNMQGAYNVPLIEDKLSIRVAGLFDTSNGNNVRSLNNPAAPNVETTSARLSVRYEPIDTLKFNVMFERLNLHTEQYTQVAGPGSPGYTTLAALGTGGAQRVIPANYNSPAISTDDRAAVQTTFTQNSKMLNLITGSAEWQVLNHTLAYNLGAQNTVAQHSLDANDISHQMIGYASQTHVDNAPNTAWTHELRLSSIRGDHFLDYDIGAYYYHTGSTLNYAVPAGGAYLPGAFGAPGPVTGQYLNGPNPNVSQAAVDRYSLPLTLNIGLAQTTYSFYSNLQFHLTDTTELSGGIRWIHDTRPSSTAGVAGPGQVALNASAFPVPVGTPCSALGLQSNPIYGAGYCESPVGSTAVSFPDYKKVNTPTIYNVSLSQHFTRDVLAYATVGSSYRTGIGNLGITTNDARLLQANPEHATSYELGIKTSWDNKVRLNADIFQIEYKGQLTQSPGINYLDTVSNPGTPTVKQVPRTLYQNADARVQGAELEFAYKPSKSLSLGANASYAKIASKGGSLPCNDPSRPLTPTNIVNYCAVASGNALNTVAPLQANVSGNYTVPVGTYEGYVRVLGNYQGHNPNFGYDKSTDAYMLWDLFLGATSADRAWDVGVYGKNLFNKEVELTSQTITPDTAVYFGPSGLSQVSMTAPRELGVTVRYAFGSR